MVLRLQSAVLVAAQPLAATLRLFFLRCYREFDVSQTIAVLGLLQWAWTQGIL